MSADDGLSGRSGEKYQSKRQLNVLEGTSEIGRYICSDYVHAIYDFQQINPSVTCNQLSKCHIKASFNEADNNFM